jgi:hypothetical protein
MEWFMISGVHSGPAAGGNKKALRGGRACELR